MDKRTISIIIAIFLGGTIGLFVANGIMPANFWWVGMIAGGAIAYFSYDFQTVKGAAKSVLCAPFSFDYVGGFIEFGKVVAIFWGIVFFVLGCGGWSIIIQHYSNISIEYIGPASLAIIVIWTIVTMIIHHHLDNSDDSYKHPHNACIFSALSCGIWFAIGLMGLIGFSSLASPAVRGAIDNILVWFGLTVAISVGGVLLYTCYEVSIIAGKLLFRLAKTIYGEERLLCMMSAAIGVGLGHLATHDPWLSAVGGVIGVIIGVAQYEVLSKRVFKLVPISFK